MGDRFDLTLSVDETESIPTAEVFLQKAGGEEINLGSFELDIDPADNKLFVQLRGYTEDDEITSGGLMTVEVYEMLITKD